jgi:hypothetical protein
MKSPISGKMVAGLIACAALMQVVSIRATAATPQDFGGKGDVVTLQDGSINDATADFRSGSAAFTPADVGKAIVVSGAGADGGALVTKIQKFVSAKQVILVANASATVTAGVTYYGTDDTAALRACVYQSTKAGDCTLSDGTTYMVSNTSSTIIPLGAGNLPISRGSVNGTGRIIFAPQGTLTGATNDRLFFVTSREGQPMQIVGAIAKGATSFRVQEASEAATLSAGDWVVLTEMDSVAGDNVYVDWVEVSAVEGSVVHTAKPFRMPFPNARPWAGPPKHWGLSCRKMIYATSNFTFRDITIIIPKIVQGKHPVIGIDTRDTRGTVVSHISCQDASGNCFVGYMDKDLVFQNNNINGSIYSEFASEVDATISGNHIGLLESNLRVPGPPTSGGLEIDFGTGFSSITGNRIGPSRQMCLALLNGVHDTIVSGNTCGLVTFGSGASCILSRGGYRISVSENTCEGGTQASRGIDFGDVPNLTAPILSDGNRIFNNKVHGFATPYVCDGGRLRTDSCDHGR